MKPWPDLWSDANAEIRAKVKRGGSPACSVCHRPIAPKAWPVDLLATGWTDQGEVDVQIVCQQCSPALADALRMAASEYEVWRVSGRRAPGRVM